ncbi:DUF998 domain-containing protein [Chitinispirillales bacterium ANBcel5]|uniref:DUF998 domain-containing protein n=1 Tax=Cellulosispirillum alkaliphilum TaxID=3039283 RepID=UPI002A54B93E|nr:DUF998 domain-containing protein [Chitinispirillales bacterium ANBcel5]
MDKQPKNQPLNLLLLCGPAGSCFFVIMFIVQGLLREDYDGLRFPVSSLAIGEYGWIQILSFVITGVLILLFSVGFRVAATRIFDKHRLLSFLLVTAGVGLIGTGLFPSDPIYGYPPSEPLKLAQYTISGHLHNLFSLLLMASFTLACLVAAKEYIKGELKMWAVYSTASAISIVLFFILAYIGYQQVPFLVDYAGLFQRVSIISGTSYLTVTAIKLLTTQHRGFTSPP